MRLRRAARMTLATGICIAAAIQFIRPARTNPSSDPSNALAAREQVPPDVMAIINRSCRDCHSNDTRWPWYSNVAPVSWWVIDHVNHGRSHFNFSEWAKYNREEQQNLLRQSCELTRKGAMPLPSYLRMHDAVLQPAEIEAVCAFTDSMRHARR
jgi:hypothetical protein